MYYYSCSIFLTTANKLLHYSITTVCKLNGKTCLICRRINSKHGANYFNINFYWDVKNLILQFLQFINVTNNHRNCSLWFYLCTFQPLIAIFPDRHWTQRESMVRNGPIRGPERSANLSADGYRRQNQQEAALRQRLWSRTPASLGRRESGAAEPVNASLQQTLHQPPKRGEKEQKKKKNPAYICKTGKFRRALTVKISFMYFYLQLHIPPPPCQDEYNTGWIAKSAAAHLD